MKGYLRNITRLVSPYWSYALLNLLFNTLSVILNLVSLTMIIPFLELLFSESIQVTGSAALTIDPSTWQDWFNHLLGTIIESEGKIAALVFICLIVAGLFLLKNLSRYLAMYYIAPLRNNVVRDLRKSMYEHILILPLAFFSERKRGDIMARISADVLEVEWSILSFMTMIFRDPFTFVLFFTVLVIIHPGLTLMVVVFLPLAGYLISLAGKNLASESFKGQQQLGLLVSMIEETISGLRVIKAFNAYPLAEKRFHAANDSYATYINRVYRQRDLSGPVTEFLVIVAMVFILWFGGRMVLQPQSSLDANIFIFYLLVFSQLIAPARAIITAWYNVRKGSASLQRINELLLAEEVITEKENAISIHEFRDKIEFRNVGFSYDKLPVLQNIDLDLRKGKKIAIAGPSGSGKSTLLDLLPRFFDCTSGQLLIDGLDVRDLVISDVRALFGIVSQDTILFNDTVRNNIAFGLTGISDERIIHAAEIANAHEFIMQMDKGYDTIIGDQGIRLSGGQRQRIAIARAVLRDPPILLLDEATSSLDTESEKLVQEALERLLRQRTAIIVAHRLSTIISADEIIVLDKGRITERGNHASLVKAGGLYQQLYGLQNEVNNNSSST